MTEEKPEKRTIERSKEDNAETQKKLRPKNNSVFIGRKPVMNYVTACLTFFNSGSKKVVLKARGRAISRAVDTVELLRRGFVIGLQIEEISIGTEKLKGREGRTRNVSTIEIIASKP